MALDGMFLRHMKNEILSQAQGGRVSQIYQPNKDELVLGIRTMQGNKKLLLSARANSPRVHFTEFAPENPSVPPMLCMLLRKKLGGGKLLDIRQPELERILFLDFETTNELGDKTLITIVVEIMGKYSNVIITDSEGVIIDSLKRVDMTMSSQRLVLPNLRYELPPAQNKLNILSSSADEVVKRILDTDKETALNKAVLSAVQGISPIICRELEAKVSQGSELTNTNLSQQQTNNLHKEIDNLIETVKNCTGKPQMIVQQNSKPLDISFIFVTQYKGVAQVVECDSFSALLDSFYSKRDNADRMKIKSQDLNKLLSNITDRLSRKINIQQAELKKCGNREQLRISGDLLQANLYRVTKGAPFIDVENFYDEDMATIRIPLNPAVSPTANAQKFYKDYRKAKTAEKVLKVQINKAQDELEYIGTVQDSLSRASSEKELAQIRLELTEQGYIKQAKGKQKPPAALPPLEFHSSDGFKILVGRNNKQNDKLTLKTANNNDIWFHTKDIHGSHTIVVTNGREISDTAVIQAAQLAAYHSKARESSNVPVDYTQVRYVSKPSGAKPGMVIYVNNKTVYVDPNIPLQS